MTRFKRPAAYALGGLVVLLSLVYVARPAGHQPPYDANLVRLAESELEGFCAGEAFWRSGGTGLGDPALASECRSRLAGRKSAEPNLGAVSRAFCLAIVIEGWEGTVPDCVEILAQARYWPTYDGGLTDQWNRARPYPRPVISSGGGGGGSDSRTGGREDAPTRPGGPTIDDYGYPYGGP